jgi:hypothetical protein
MSKRIQPNPINTALYYSQRVGQGVKPSRCSVDPARKSWTMAYRTQRLRKLGD